MNKLSINTCPVCGNGLENGLCLNCGYVQIIFPEVIPESLRNLENQRVKSAKILFKRIADETEQFESRCLTNEKNIAKLNKELAEYLDNKKKLSSERNSLVDEVNSLKQQISSLKRELNDEKSSTQTSSRRFQSRISDLESLITIKNAEVKSISSELEDAKHRLTHFSSNPDNKLKGIVMIEDRRNDTRTMLPVYEGNNSYGTNPDDGLHHQIKFQVRGFSFRPTHFFIRTSPKGLILESAPGVEMTQNGGIVRSGVYARQSDNFMFEDRIRINITQI